MIDLLDQIHAIALEKKIKPPQLTDEIIIEDKEFREFVIKINAVQQYLKSFNIAVKGIKKSRLSLVKCSNNKEISDTKKDITTRIDSCKEIQEEIKSIIQSNDPFVKQTKIDEKYYSRIVANLYGACLKKFEKLAEGFTEEQNNYSTYIRESIIRDAEIVLEKKFNDNEKDQILENPDMVQSLLDKKLQGQAHQTMVNAVNDLAARHQDILKLERNVNEVYQMFVDLQVLVKAQGEIIDNIESNILTAKDCVLTGEQNINISYDNLKAARKKKCIVIAIIVVVLCVVLGTVLPFSL